MNVNLELYRIFYVVAKNKHMTKASKELCISQPAISQSIKKLEDQLGGILFIRSNKGMELTEEGKMFYEYVKGSLELIKTAETNFTHFKDLSKGEIKVGISTSLTKVILLNSLSYWIQSGINTSSTVIWIRALSLANGSNTINMYYGNSAASAAQNRDNTLGTTNLALNKAASASNSSTAPANAVDGSMGTVWNAGYNAPQWIEVDLGSNVLLNHLLFTVTQSPAGATVHTVYVGSSPAPTTALTTWSGSTSDAQVLTYDFTVPSTSIRYVRVKTTTSPSWVAWYELTMRGTQLNTSSQPTCSIGAELP
jgi:hypothetical protein